MNEEKIYCTQQSLANRSARTALTASQQSVTAVRKSSGTTMYTAMKAPVSVITALKIIILAAKSMTA